MTNQHTPTPWKIASRALITANTAWQAPIAICYDAQSHTQGVDAKEADANAEFIVRACNAHDDLVAALREAISDEEARLESIHLNPERYNSKTIPYFEERVERWKIALAKAKAVQS